MDPISGIVPAPRRARWLAALALSLACGGLSAYPEDYDVIVYGGTSGGVTAAVQVAKMGRKVAIVSPTKHLGGLSSSGLGWTDLGDISILGGLSREFYHRVFVHYSGQANWETVRKMNGQGGAKVGDYGTAFNPTYQTGSIFEPKVAEGIFNAFVAENNIPVFTGLLDLDGGVILEGNRITGIRLEDGRVFVAKMFIDAGYEGDLMAGAGVSWTIGREANSVYGETISGVQSNAGNQVRDNVDPYVVKGNPASGLLPGVNASIAANGTGDHRLQAYCYRMCLTNSTDPAKREMVPQPAGYNEADFELVIRAVEAGETNFFKTDRMPNAKTDSNNTGGISTDYIGMNYGDGWNWATLNHQQRDALARKHEYWQRGLIWTIQKHPRVLAKVGSAGLYSSWGLPKDEFTDNGYWPHQLYVREARRMVSDYVMTQKNCSRSVVAPDSVGMAAYTMDSHNVQRYNKGGMVKNEGDVQQGTAGPYPISYRSIIPKAGECGNLLVPWCLSSSHMAFGSIRMEPVFMALGQSAATAAVIAINDNVSVQQVPYEKLAMKLRADGQALRLGSEDATISGIVVDNNDAGAAFTGAWVSSTSVGGYNGSNYVVDNNSGDGTRSVRFTPQIPVSGVYEVTLRWTSDPNRANNVPVKIQHRDGVYETTVNQRLDSAKWNVLGSFHFEAGSAGSLFIQNAGTNGYVIADAAQWTMPDGPTCIAQVIPSVPEAVRGSGIPGEFVFSRYGSTSSAVTVNYALSGTGAAGDVSPALTGSAVIPAGAREVRLTALAAAGSIPAGTKTLTLTLVPDAAYFVGASSSATLTVRDSPFDAWRSGRFTAGQLGDPAISGPLADPDGNGTGNLMEFFSGGGPAPFLLAQGGNLYLKVRRHRDAQGMKMRVWESADLSSWSATPELIMEVPLERSGDFQDISLPVRSGSTFNQGRRFFQLRIEK